MLILVQGAVSSGNPLDQSPLQHSRLQSPDVTIPMSQALQFVQGALSSHVPAPPELPPWFDVHDVERSVREQACWRRVMARKGDEPLSRSSGCETTCVWTSDTSLCHVPGVIPISSELASKEEGGSYFGLKPSHSPGPCCTPLPSDSLSRSDFIHVSLAPWSYFWLLIPFLPLLHGDSALTAPGCQVNHSSLWRPLGLFSTKVLSVLQLSCSQPAFL